VLKENSNFHEVLTFREFIKLWKLIKNKNGVATEALSENSYESRSTLKSERVLVMVSVKLLIKLYEKLRLIFLMKVKKTKLLNNVV
jgi:hypothetical protein